MQARDASRIGVEMYLIMRRGTKTRTPLARASCLTAVALFAATALPAVGQGSNASSGSRAVQLPLSGRQPGSVTVQQSAPVPSGASANVQVQIQGGFSGSVPGTDAIPESFDLTLADAIQRGLRANLGIISADISVQGAQARRVEARSALMPSISVNASENAAKLNLAAEGFSASAFEDRNRWFHDISPLAEIGYTASPWAKREMPSVSPYFSISRDRRARSFGLVENVA